MASGSATAPRLRLRGRGRSPARGSSRRVSWPRRLLLVVALAAVLAGGYQFWLRDSSLVAVDAVKIEGLTSLSDPSAGNALERAARDMTTLHVELEELGRAVAQYPTIKSLSASPSLPNGLTITVVERPPVALAGEGGVPVAADGTLLPGVDAGEGRLPVLDVAVGEGGGTLDGPARDQAIVLGAAPEPLAGIVERSENTPDGVQVLLSNGISLRFGDGSRAAAKWEAATRILADPSLSAMTYIDLRVPDRPAVGGGVPIGEVTELPPPG